MSRSLCAIQKQLSEDGVPSPTGKAQWDLQSIRKLLKRDLYRPNTYVEIQEIVGPDVLASLDPGGSYGVYWFGERTETRKRVSKSGEGGRVYRHRYTSRVRSVAERIGVPVPDSGIPREWVDGARANLAENRRTANAGRRFWDLSAGILRCSEYGRVMSPRTASRAYFYYACTAGPNKRHQGCSAKKFHAAFELEERVWSEVSAILADPEKLRAGLDEMIERERVQMLGNPAKEATTLTKRLREIKGRRSRYQEMAAGLIDFDELRERLAGIEDERGDTERARGVIERRAEHLERLEQNRNVLLEEYAGAVPETLGALFPEERHGVYRVLRLQVTLAPSGDLEMSGDVVPTPLCRTETPYRRD